MAVFLQELQERTRDLEQDLLSLENSANLDERQKRIQSLLRAVHSLKGAAGLVGMADVEMVCHRMEDLFVAARDGIFEPDQAVVQLLLRSTDALAEAGRRATLGEPPSAAPLEAVGAELIVVARRVFSAGGSTLPAQSAPGDATDPSAILTGEAEPVETQDQVVEVEPFARVPATKLDELLKQSGELLIARSRAKLRIEQLATLQEVVRTGVRRRSVSYLGRRARRVALATTTVGAGPADIRGGEDPSLPRDDADILFQISKKLQVLAADLSRDRRAIEQTANSLDLEVRGVRLQPFASACAGLDRLVRDLAIASGKKAYLELSGGEVEIDRSVTEALHDILRHLVRNAVDHGIESIEERRSAGKPERGSVKIAAALAGDRITVRLGDDGGGLNVERIQEQARKIGVQMGADDEPLRQIFLPGLSTSSAVTTTSGRGVGLDVVKTMVERMRGAVDVSYRAGHGTSFTLTLPTTLGTIRALLVKVAEQTFAIDTSSVARLIRVAPDEIRFADERMLILTGSAPAPALDLRDWLGLSPATAEGVTPERRPAVVLNEIGKGAAILVDAVLAEQELLVRTVGRRLQKLRGYSGGSILPDGTIALVINAAWLGEGAIKRQSGSRIASVQEPRARLRVLIADDSVTTRTLEKTILEGAGYQVSVAADGEQAWQLLQKNGVDLVLADVDMPERDGFALTETIRQSARFRHIPVILLTARETAEDRRRGLEAGADAYLVKSAFDQRELLRAIAELI